MKQWFQRARQPRQGRPECTPRFRPRLECLEDRRVPAGYNLAINPAANNAVAVAELIAAINAANGSAQDDTINLFAGGTYTLTAADNATAGGNGLPVLGSGSGALDIQGNGATIARSSTGGTPDFRFFLINGGNLTLDDLTLTNGRSAPGQGGGAIRIDNGQVTLQNNSSISNNTAPGLAGGGGVGGAIADNNGLVTILNSTIANNTANNDGGGIFLGGSGGNRLIVNSSLFTNNSGNQGGGIGINDGKATITNSTFTLNKALTSNGGGAIFVQNFPTVTIDGSLLSANTANNGGGLLVNGGNVTVTNTTITGNTSTGTRGGGGILAISSSGAAVILTVTNSTITDNWAQTAGTGGGLMARVNTNNNVTVTINGTTIGNNVSGPGLTPDDLHRIDPTGAYAAQTVTVNASFSVIESGGAAINGTNVSNILGKAPSNGGPTPTDQAVVSAVLPAPSQNPSPMTLPPTFVASSANETTTAQTVTSQPIATKPGQTSDTGPSGGGATLPAVVAATEIVPAPREVPPAATVTPSTPAKPAPPTGTANKPPTTPTPSTASTAPAVTTRPAMFPPETPVFAVQFLRNQLDNLPDPEQQASVPETEKMVIPTVAVAGGLTVGYVLFYSRVAYLLLSMLTAGTVWREIDPVAFLEYWEEEGRKKQADASERKAESMFD
ncbi:hypothetical protein AYO44_03110 [Planctomycetaceae bacterium SCGC AG-212-F19]|nr:hypothetical protein AYO44_03110 [Planctomycetaceae bacterium SCGC AG-212-F19]